MKIHSMLFGGVCVLVLGCETPPAVKVTRPGGAGAASSSFVSSGGQSETVVAPAPAPAMTAIQAVKQKAAADPLNWRCFNELGLAYRRVRRYDEAVAAFEQALALHPITTTLEAEKKQQEAIDAQHAAMEETQRRQQQYQQDAQNAAAMNQIFSSVLGALPAMPGADMQAMVMLPTVDALSAAANQPDVPLPVNAPKAAVESQLKPKREVAGIYYHLGLALFDRGSYSQAMVSLDNSLSLDPSRVEALWWQAESLFKQGIYRKMILTTDRYLALGTATPACYLRLSDAFRALGLDREAERAYQAGVQAHRRRIASMPGNVEAIRDLVAAALSHDRYADAEQDILVLLAGTPSAVGRLDLAVTQLLQSRYAEALQNVQAVLGGTETGYDASYAWYLVGRCHDELGDSDPATSAYRRSADLLDRLPPENAVPAHAAVVWAAVGRAEEARRCLEADLSRDPWGTDAAMVWFRLGLVCEKGGWDVEAIEALNRSLTLRPRYRQAGVVLERLAKRHATECQKALAEGEAAVTQKDPGAAVRRFAAAYQVMAAGARKQEVLQRMLRVAGEMETAPALTVEAQRYYLRGNAALKSAKEPVDLDRAISEFQWAAVYAPWSAPIYLNLSAAYGVRLRYGKAVESLKAFLVASPRARNVEEALAKLAELEYQQEENLRSLSFKGVQ